MKNKRQYLFVKIFSLFLKISIFSGVLVGSLCMSFYLSLGEGVYRGNLLDNAIFSYLFSFCIIYLDDIFQRDIIGRKGDKNGK